MKFLTFTELQHDQEYVNDIYSNLFKVTEATDVIYIPNAYLYANVNKQIDVLNSILAVNPNIKIWIGTPGITSENFTTPPSLATMEAFIKDTYNALSNPNAVEGVYFNQEAIYGDLTYGNMLNGSLPGDKQVQLMNNTKNMLNGIIGKNNMLWVPYYGFGDDPATIIKNLGYVADTLSIFTYVCVQPHYAFDPTVESNLNGVKYSVENNRICYRDGVPVISSPVAGKPTIGYEMEYSHNTCTPEIEDRYQAYVDTFNTLKSKPMGFYWDVTICSTEEINYADEITVVNNTINSFLE